MTDLIARFHALRASRDRGATAVEYGFMVLLIALVIIGGVTALGVWLRDTFAGVATDF